MKDDHHSGPIKQRIQPKLRMICNGDAGVNALRALQSGAVAAQRPADFAAPTTAAAATAVAAADPPASVDDDAAAARRVRVSLFVELDRNRVSSDDPGREGPLAGARTAAATARRGRLLTCEADVADVDAIAAHPDVAYVSVGDALTAPDPSIETRHVGAPAGLRSVDSELAAGGGVGVLIGIIDVGGFDFAHEAFLNDDRTQTRFSAIWDQGADPAEATGGLRPPDEFGYGVEITAERMDAALEWARTHAVNPTDLVPQSVQVMSAHATHVASIAAGNYGVAPRAALVGVLVALSEEDRDRRRSLYDSTRLAHAVNWLIYQAEILGIARADGDPEAPPLPLVINISLGTNGHAHDGSSPISRWIDSALNIPGRCVVAAAGNAGQEAPRASGDIGWMSGRVHSAGRIAASGLETDLEWRVVGNGVLDSSENELEIWYEPQDRFDVLLRPPGGDWIGPVPQGRYYRNLEQPDGTFVSIFNERYHPANGANRISIYLSPRLADPVVGVSAGTWTIRLRGVEVRDGRFHAWIERDDPRRLGRVGDREAWRFPSFFSARSNVDAASVSSLACGHRVVSVANYEEAAERISASSSQGPTRDGRFKPEIAAPGADIVAARGFSSPRDAWVAMSGTSMASPYVAGVAALMLAVEPRLTSLQIVGIMRRTAQPLPGADYTWQDDAGFGRIRPERCLAEAATAFEEVDLEP